MSKAQAKQVTFDYINLTAKLGLPNLADPTQANFVPPIIPTKMRPVDAADYFVIALVPIPCLVGYGKECPCGKNDDTMTITALQSRALQNNHDALFAWATALEFLMNNHGGTSLYKLVPENTRITHFLPLPQQDGWGTVLFDKIWKEPAAMSPVDNYYTTTCGRFAILAFHVICFIDKTSAVMHWN
jgi:hypothetical protein